MNPPALGVTINTPDGDADSIFLRANTSGAQGAESALGLDISMGIWHFATKSATYILSVTFRMVGYISNLPREVEMVKIAQIASWPIGEIARAKASILRRVSKPISFAAVQHR